MNDNNHNGGSTAVFVGSFDPFTEGHADIARRALLLFDHLVIGVGVNPKKEYMFSTDQRVSLIRKAMADDSRIEVEAYSDLTIDFARRHNARAIVKGLRNADDFVYEMPQADYNRQHGGIETVFLPSTPELRNVSSTAVRQAINNRKSE